MTSLYPIALLELRLTQMRLRLITSQLAIWPLGRRSVSVESVPIRRRKPKHRLGQARRLRPLLQQEASKYQQIVDGQVHLVRPLIKCCKDPYLSPFCLW